MKKGRKNNYFLFVMKSAEACALQSLSIVKELNVEQVSAIHDLRVCCKKLRSYHRAVRHSLPNKSVFRIRDQHLKQVAQTMSSLRDNHVNLNLVLKFKKAMLASGDNACLSLLQSRFSPEDVCFALEKQNLLDVLSAEVAHWQSLKFLVDYPKDQQREGFATTYSKARKLGKQAIALGLSEVEAHQWRKWTKYLYYQLQILPPDVLSKSGRLGDLQQLGNSLGKLHDLYILNKIIDSDLEAQEVCSSLLADIKKQQNKIMEKITGLFDDCFHEKELRFRH